MTDPIHSLQPGQSVLVDFRPLGWKFATLIQQLPGSGLWLVAIQPGTVSQQDLSDYPKLPWGTFRPMGRSGIYRLSKQIDQPSEADT